VSDYVEPSVTLGLRGTFAVLLNVTVEDVTLVVEAGGSVLLIATITVPSTTTTAAVQAQVEATMGTAESASTSLGLSIVTDPVVTVATTGTSSVPVQPPVQPPALPPALLPATPTSSPMSPPTPPPLLNTIAVGGFGSSSLLSSEGDVLSVGLIVALIAIGLVLVLAVIIVVMWRQRHLQRAAKATNDNQSPLSPAGRSALERARSCRKELEVATVPPIRADQGLYVDEGLPHASPLTAAGLASPTDIHEEAILEGFPSPELHEGGGLTRMPKPVLAPLQDPSEDTFVRQSEFTPPPPPPRRARWARDTAERAARLRAEPLLVDECNPSAEESVQQMESSAVHSVLVGWHEPPQQRNNSPASVPSPAPAISATGADPAPTEPGMSSQYSWLASLMPSEEFYSAQNELWSVWTPSPRDRPSATATSVTDRAQLQPPTRLHSFPSSPAAPPPRFHSPEARLIPRHPPPPLDYFQSSLPRTPSAECARRAPALVIGDCAPPSVPLPRGLSWSLSRPAPPPRVGTVPALSPAARSTLGSEFEKTWSFALSLSPASTSGSSPSSPGSPGSAPAAMDDGGTGSDPTSINVMMAEFVHMNELAELWAPSYLRNRVHRRSATDFRTPVVVTPSAADAPATAERALAPNDRSLAPVEAEMEPPRPSSRPREQALDWLVAEEAADEASPPDELRQTSRSSMMSPAGRQALERARGLSVDAGRPKNGTRRSSRSDRASHSSDELSWVSVD